MSAFAEAQFSPLTSASSAASYAACMLAGVGQLELELPLQFPFTRSSKDIMEVSIHGADYTLYRIAEPTEIAPNMLTKWYEGNKI